MMRWWINLLPFGLVVWLSRSHLERLHHEGVVIEVRPGVLISVSEAPHGS